MVQQASFCFYLHVLHNLNGCREKTMEDFSLKKKLKSKLKKKKLKIKLKTRIINSHSLYEFSEYLFRIHCTINIFHLLNYFNFSENKK